MIAWRDGAGIDVFNLARTVVPDCIDDVVNLLVPALQERGAYKIACQDGTLREKMFGGSRLPGSPCHPDFIAVAERLHRQVRETVDPL